MHHLSPSGRVTRMERTYADFNGPIDKVYRFATQHFGSYDRLKDVRRVVFQTRSDTDTKIRITYRSDDETRRDLTDIESFSWQAVPARPDAPISGRAAVCARCGAEAGLPPCAAFHDDAGEP